MRELRITATLLISLAAVLQVSSCYGPVARLLNRRPPTRVLFIGNRYASNNGGIDEQLKGLAPWAETERIDAGGYTLENHWDEGDAVRTIQQSKLDYVVLQEQSQTSVTSPKSFEDSIGKFNAEIEAAGAKTILLMTWERPDSVVYGVTAANVRNAYQTAGAKLGVLVAPAGSAFVRSLPEKPALQLYAADGHPTIAGTYLAACVLYGAIFQMAPVGNRFSDWSISAEQRAFLQQVAADTLGF